MTIPSPMRILPPLIIIAAVCACSKSASTQEKAVSQTQVQAKTTEESCQGSSSWLPQTPPASIDKPAPHPAPDCPFYQNAWQRFLIVTQPLGDGRPAFLEYPTLTSVFQDVTSSFPTCENGLSLAVRNLQHPNDMTLADVRQAEKLGGLGGLLIDQRGHPIFYAIHMNPVFVAFLKNNSSGKDLTKVKTGDDVPDMLDFAPGIIELKSAWMIVDDQTPRRSSYFTTSACVPHFAISNGKLVATASSERVTVALIAIHVVFALKGHPELIWSTFEHTGSNGMPDNAPAAKANPSKLSPTEPISNDNFALYKAGTLAKDANVPLTEEQLANGFDEKSQSFVTNGVIHQTSVYRPYPGSKSDGKTADDFQPDSDVTDLNSSMNSLFAAAHLPDDDKRSNYRLIGAVWINDPANNFQKGKAFTDPIDQSTDEDNAVLAGEGRLGSTAMESFTEREAEAVPAGAPNCFSCHDTQTISVGGKRIMKAKLLNVSHIISKFLSGAQKINR